MITHQQPNRFIQDSLYSLSNSHSPLFSDSYSLLDFKFPSSCFFSNLRDTHQSLTRRWQSSRIPLLTWRRISTRGPHHTASSQSRWTQTSSRQSYYNQPQCRRLRIPRFGHSSSRVHLSSCLQGLALWYTERRPCCCFMATFIHSPFG